MKSRASALTPLNSGCEKLTCNTKRGHHFGFKQNWLQPPSSVCSWLPGCHCRPKRVPCPQKRACRQLPGQQVKAIYPIHLVHMMVYPTGTWFCANRCWFVHQINQHYCSLPPSWKGLRQGWQSLACIERWRPRVPWTPPETDLYCWLWFWSSVDILIGLFVLSGQLTVPANPVRTLPFASSSFARPKSISFTR